MPALRKHGFEMPPYRYVPGLNPHPFRHQGGHMYTDGSAPSEEPWAPKIDWRDDHRHLFAADLFDHRFMWEAHEAWEALWHYADDGSAERALLQGLICCAAASLKHHMEAPTAAAKLHARAVTVIKPWSDTPVIYGVVHAEVLADTERHLRGGPWPTLHLVP